jgi:hypothetical protein
VLQHLSRQFRAAAPRATEPPPQLPHLPQRLRPLALLPEPTPRPPPPT